MAFNATPVRPPLPACDEPLAIPETRYEVLDGELVYVPPADPPHAARHSKASALVEVHAADDFTVASDMLTRTSATDDFAPDVSVFPTARDPVTGGRQLEHLAFEVVSRGSLGPVAEKARKLTTRGVRRVFVIDIERARVLEWSTELASWRVLDTTAHIEDRCLAAPLPVAALLDDASANEAIAQALIIRRNPAIEAVKVQSRREGRREGQREGKRERGAAALLAVLAARGIPLTERDRARILGEQDPDRVLAWIARAATCSTLAEVLDEPALR
jgi:Uma2 family endonuclease